MAIALAQSACLGAIGSPGEEAELVEIGFALDNGFVLPNGLNLTNGTTLANGIKLTNGVDLSNGLDATNGIKLTNGLIEPPTGSGLEQWIDVEPEQRLRTLRYLVECALPPADEVEVVYRGASSFYTGRVGLAAGWASGSMSAAEKEKVSGCLLARVNAAGVTVRIDLFGPMPGLDAASADELGEYSHQEGVFFGNLFAESPVAFACGLGGLTEQAEFRACRGPDCGIIRPLLVTRKIQIFDGDQGRFIIVTYLRDCFSGSLCQRADLGSGYSYASGCTYGGHWQYPVTTHMATVPGE